MLRYVHATLTGHIADAIAAQFVFDLAEEREEGHV